MIESATDSEGELADAMRGEHPEAVAEFLRLADGGERAALLRLGLRERLAPGDDGLGVPEAERYGVFAKRFRVLVLPGLDGEAQEQAEAMLGMLEGRRL